ncbi:MAG: HAMP domain-containing protein [Spirochaetaceae bacterium]|nr:MAG: HAMP domain-containing protein [Spirochaetaceae bacterium]
MKIRSKITLVVIPILVLTLGISGVWAYFSATSGITKIANSFLTFKVENMKKAAESQWALLVDSSLTGDARMIAAAKSGVSSHAIDIMRSRTELILAFDKELNIAMKTNEVTVLDNEKQFLTELFTSKPQGLFTFILGGIERVGMGFAFEPFGWFVLVTEQKSVFYEKVNQISWQTGAMLAISIILAVVILFIVTQILTSPLVRVVTAMKEIISDTDLSRRVQVEYQDETGELAHTFNIMVEQLQKSDRQIRKFALEAVLAQKRETKIRNIFQKYVPKDIIDKYFENPESMLVGDMRVLSILFSDIRDFTTISEKLSPDEIVNSLNRYFSIMVDVILNRNGIVDKYIGDAIMAFFGAPVKHEDDALQSVMAGIEMTEKVVDFNRTQVKLKKPEFKIGVGINYGFVTVGNIGTEKKMDYTVIGEMVNLASRLEGLTKYYHQELLISESLQRRVSNKYLCREIDCVAVKGSAKGMKIYYTKREPTALEKEAWEIHNNTLPLYYKGDFIGAASGFSNVQKILPGDYPSRMFMEESVRYQKNPPKDWIGIRKMDTK